MLTRFSKLTLSAVTALSLAAAPMPAAAEPGGQDFARGLVGLAILGILANSSNNSRSTSTTTRSNTAQIRTINNRNGVINGELRRPNHSVSNRGYKRAALPSRCRLILNTSRGDRLVFGERCMNRNFKFASKLPEQCERRVRTNRGVRTVFGARCLSRDGWRISQR